MYRRCGVQEPMLHCRITPDAMPFVLQQRNFRVLSGANLTTQSDRLDDGTL